LYEVVEMSIRTQRYPGAKLGLGNFVNSDIDAKQRVVYFGTRAWTAATVKHNFTQGATRMATIECVQLAGAQLIAKASASLEYKVGTISGGTVMIRHTLFTSGAATGLKQTVLLHYWMVGTPDVNRLIV
jgi:hypothetical protein